MRVRKIVAVVAAAFALALLAVPARAQEIKLVSETVTVQADATHEADPDTATLTFTIQAQEKELKKAYDRATTAMQRILALAERSGLAKSEISAGALRVVPVQDWSDRKLKARAYRVENQITLKTRDFTKIAPLVDGAVEEGIVEFRSLVYSLADEEPAKRTAIVEAVHRAENRARAALGDTKRALGPLRALNVEIKQLVPVAAYDPYSLASATRFLRSDAPGPEAAPPPPPPTASPQKISVLARVQCIFQLQ